MLKPIPPGMSFEQALRTGFAGRLESQRYTNWVKTLRCVCCNQPADDPHHPYDVGFGGMGTKVPDWWVIPLTRRCHDALHCNVVEWEGRHGSQMHHALMTLTLAIREGILRPA
jgi:hypothetical protein